MNDPEFITSTEFGVLLAVQLIHALITEMANNWPKSTVGAL